MGIPDAVDIRRRGDDDGDLLLQPAALVSIEKKTSMEIARQHFSTTTPCILSCPSVHVWSLRILPTSRRCQILFVEPIPFLLSSYAFTTAIIPFRNFGPSIYDACPSGLIID
jgi:hypothetical protein